MKKAILFTILILSLCTLAYTQHTDKVLVYGKVFSKKQVGSLAHVYFFNVRNTKLIYKTQANKKGYFKIAVKPERYNLFVNGQFVKSHYFIGKKLRLKMKVEDYILKIKQRKSMFVGGVGIVGVSTVTAAGGAIIGGATVLVTNPGFNTDEGKEVDRTIPDQKPSS